MTADRTSCCGGIDTERKLAIEDTFHTATRFEYQNHVGGLNAHLPTNVASSQSDEDWHAPTSLVIAQQQHTMSATDPDDKAPLDDVGDDGHRVGVLEQFPRDTLDR